MHQRFEPKIFSKFAVKVLGKIILVDAFDNFPTRRNVIKFFDGGYGDACIHAGMSGDGFGEVVWNEKYKIPNNAKSVGPDVCEYPLARNLVLMTSTLCVELIIRYVMDEKKINANYTHGDMHIRLW